jgi:adenosylhomocysteine nucleosidase
MSAFQPELAALLSRAEITGSTVINGRTCYLGRLSGQEVVLLETGISMVNAAMMAQTVILRFPVRAIVFSGVAGGIDPELNLCDVVVPARWAQ